MRLITILFFMVILSFQLSSCSKGSNSTTSTTSTLGTVSTPGGSAFAGLVTVGADCQSQSGVVQVYNYQTQQLIQSVSVSNGQTYNIQLQPGTYYMLASAGICSVQAQVTCVANQVNNTPVCLGSACSNRTGYLTKVDSTATTSCAWDVYGCASSYFPGAGNVVISGARIYLTSKSDQEFNLQVSPIAGNTMIASAPAYLADGWPVKISKTSKLESNKVALDFLSYDLQVFDHHLQFEESICASRTELLGKMAEHLSASGFSTTTVDAFKAQWKDHLPPNERLCAFPQGTAQIEASAIFKTAINLSTKRMWFVIIPEVDQVLLNLKKPSVLMASLINKKTKDAASSLAKSKPARIVASETSETTAEETGLGYMLVK